MSDDLVSKLISQLDEKEGTSVFDPSASVLNRVGDYAERTERESLEEGSGDVLRGTIVYKTGEAGENFDLCLKFNEETGKKNFILIQSPQINASQLSLALCSWC